VDKFPGWAPGAPSKLPNSLNNKSRISAVLLELRVPGILVKGVKLPNSLMKNTRKLGFLIGSWDAPGAPGINPSRKMAELRQIFFARGLDRCLRDGYINRMAGAARN
jgi:hypothetical protein